MKKFFSKTNIAWISLILFSFVLLTLLMNLGILNNVYSTVLISIIINIILAISLNLIIGVCGQFSLGHAGFMCIGAYCAAIMIRQMGGLLGLFVGVLIGLVISAIVALIVAIPTLRLKGDYLAIATLGFGEIIRIAVLNMEITNGAAGLTIPKVCTWPLVFGTLILCTVVILNFGLSAAGRACISIREDEIASEAMGINTTKYKVLAFVIGAMVASVGGVLYASNFYVINPAMFSFNKSIDILVIVVFGGMGSFTGSFIAAIVVGILNTILQNFADVRTIIYGLALVCIMIFRPQGLLGTKEFVFSRFFKKKDKEVLS